MSSDAGRFNEPPASSRLLLHRELQLENEINGGIVKIEEELKDYGFDVPTYRRAKRYEKDSLKLGLVESFLSVAALAAFGIWGSDRLYRVLSGFFPCPWGVRILYIAIFVVGAFILGLPGGWGSYRIERAYKLSRQSLNDWFGDQVKSLGVTLTLSLITLVPLFWVMRATTLWWVWSWIVGTGVIVFISFISPTVLMPIFYNFEEIDDEGLIERLTGLADRSGVDVIGAFRMDAGEKTKKATGGLTGIGSSRRIIISDTMLENYSNEEIEAVMAHEMGHHKHGDIWVLLIEQSLSLLLGLFLVSLFLGKILVPLGLGLNVSSLPFLLGLIGLLEALVSPLRNYVSRLRERQADEFSLRTVNNPAALGDGLVKLSQQNLGNPAPTKLVELLFHDHPAGLSRARRAYQWPERE